MTCIGAEWKLQSSVAGEEQRGIARRKCGVEVCTARCAGSRNSCRIMIGMKYRGIIVEIKSAATHFQAERGAPEAESLLYQLAA